MQAEMTHKKKWNKKRMKKEGEEEERMENPLGLHLIEQKRHEMKGLSITIHIRMMYCVILAQSNSE